MEVAAATLFDDNGLLDGVPDEPADVALLRDAVADERLWVAVAGGSAIVGFALARWCDDDAHLQELDVLPEWGRRGIGRRLVAAVVAWAAGRGRERVTLTDLHDGAVERAVLRAARLRGAGPRSDWTVALRETWEHERAMGLADG